MKQNIRLGLKISSNTNIKKLIQWEGSKESKGFEEIGRRNRRWRKWKIVGDRGNGDE